ncbi:C5a anaphylatoxin chemotactic receptor 1-like [Suncus etruscus]|uniref:C5a anaphylatoxin chemotactic receptor 1-like n=1 Tax=Suncus etruscus TaxID=109475 RepID=UPI00210F5322|nr:C5a anaphylatoxin chemotactic receptor 1-like [Suncus etruscus]
MDTAVRTGACHPKPQAPKLTDHAHCSIIEEMLRTGPLKNSLTLILHLTCLFHGPQDFNNITEVDYSYYDNITLDGPVDGPHPTPRLKAHEVAAVVIFMIDLVVGVPGNILVLWVTGSEARRTVNAIWFLNLALADLLSCLALPILIATTLLYGNWPLDEAACRILPSLILLSLFASILLLATISADRFLIVFKPIWCQNYRVSRLAWLASGVAWMLALVLTIPSFLFRRVEEDPFSKKVFCGVDYGADRKQVNLAVSVTHFVLCFLGPLVTLSVCYIFLLLRTWSRPATRSTKTLKVVVAVVTSFFVFWLPYHVSGLVLSFLSKQSPSFKLALSLDVLWVALAYVNCCINPIIYVAAARGLHIQVVISLPSRLQQLLTEDLDMKSESHSLPMVDIEVQKDKTQV